LFHTSHYFHIAIHEAGFLLAVFLFGMTLIAYQQTKITRMLFSAAAFGTLAIGQLVYLFEKIDVPKTVVMNISGENIFDLSILVMTALFALGLFYKR
jgi:nitrate reductase gamma subunit